MNLLDRSNWAEPAHQETFKFRPMDDLDLAYINMLQSSDEEGDYAKLEDVEIGSTLLRN